MFHNWPASLVTPCWQDINLCGICHKDLTFTSSKQGAWTVDIWIKTLKGYRNNKLMTITPKLEPLHWPGNVFLEPMVPLLALLIHQRALKVHSPEGRTINSMHDLFNSNAFRLVGVGNDPVFQTQSKDGKIIPMDTRAAATGLAVHTSLLGLLEALFHSICHNFARQVCLMFNANMAWTLLTHKYCWNTLEQHYTNNVAMFNLMGLCAGERVGEHLQSQLQRSFYNKHQLNGLAYWFVALEDDTNKTKPKLPFCDVKTSHLHKQAVANAEHLLTLASTSKGKAFQYLAKGWQDSQAFCGSSTPHTMSKPRS